MQFKHPPLLHDEAGNLRTVGFELEYTNLGIEDSVRIIQELYGGSLKVDNRFKQHVNDTSLGDFTAEFDLTLLTEKRYKKVFEPFNIYLEDVKMGDGTLEESLENALEGIVGKLFPYEIACPPVPITQLEELEKLREALHQHRAEGTQAFPTNAFGTHINVEVPSLELTKLLHYLQAFLLLYPWLLEVGRTDLARKLSPFIDPFPVPYVNLVLRPAYNPSLENLVLDYHQYNPDRNRPLDLYPLFAFLQQDLLLQFTNLGKVKARRAFHYRLPNSSLADPDWTLAQEWNNWVEIEKLANDKEKLAEMSREYLSLKEHTLMGFERKWIKRVEEWLS